MECGVSAYILAHRRRQCYSNITARSKQERPIGLSPVWRAVKRADSRTVIMYREGEKGVQMAPMYRHSFRPRLAHTLAEREWITYADPNALRTVGERLRYYRLLRGMEQVQVVAQVGLCRSAYSRYEEANEQKIYPLDKLSDIATVLNVPFSNLLDDYHRFLCEGQGKRIKDLRETLCLSRQEFARRIGVWTSTVRDWECEKSRISKDFWKKIVAIEAVGDKLIFDGNVT